ncbi:LysR family transcriptional regulator [uncultured Roseibium sp.]|uniref:LysR family transcriptional regulator n=1 Tax=uncultured Roseibium sp. TaxID=1936171 RepID=UPI0026139B03|nr:LysR family transcriptional regulator [uncultured Roseibium sp.]
MNRFAEIEAFVAVVETGSFSAAAERQGVAISAVSRRVDEMEARLGVRLTLRSTRGVKATERGREYYAHCLRLLSDLNEADSAISGQDRPIKGLIRVACPPAFGLRYLAPLANQFAASNPEIHFDMELSDRPVDLIEGGFDFAIRLGHLDDPALTSEPLFSVHYVVAASPAFWDQYGRPGTPEDLTGFPALAYRVGPDPARWRFSRPNGQKLDVQLSPRIVTNNGTVLVDAAKAGLGVCLEPSFVCNDAILEGTLETVLNDHRTYGRDAKLVRPAARPLSRRAEEFVDTLRGAFAITAPWEIKD